MLTPTLAVTDLADGSGGTATITGSSPGSTNTVSIQNTDGELGGAWVVAGSRVGDGAVAIATGAGFYFVKVESSLAGESVVGNLVYLAFTDGEEAVHYRCLQAAKARIILLALTGLTADRIYVRWLPLSRQLIEEETGVNKGKTKFPYIAVCPHGTESELEPGMNGADDVGYPVFVGIVDRMNQELTADLAENLLWRQQLMTAFRGRRFSSMCEGMDVTIEPLPIIEVDQFYGNIFASGFRLRVRVRQTR